MEYFRTFCQKDKTNVEKIHDYITTFNFSDMQLKTVQEKNSQCFMPI